MLGKQAAHRADAGSAPSPAQAALDAGRERAGLNADVKRVRVVRDKEPGSMGAVVALLIGGAGASIPELTLLGSLFRRRTVAAFALTVFLVAVATGLAVEAQG